MSYYQVCIRRYVLTASIIPYNHWPWVKCGLQICGTFSGYKHVDADRTLARTTTLTETLTLTITLSLTLFSGFSHSVTHRQHFTGGRNHWVKRLVHEVAGSSLNGR